MATTPKVNVTRLVKGKEVREAESPAQVVELQYNGWTVEEPKKSSASTTPSH